MIGYSVLAFAGLYLLAPLFPLVIGKEFARTVEALRWLATLAAAEDHSLFSSRFVVRRRLPGNSRGCQVCVALTNVGLNFWLIPAVFLARRRLVQHRM